MLMYSPEHQTHWALGHLGANVVVVCLETVIEGCCHIIILQPSHGLGSLYNPIMQSFYALE